MKTKRLCVILVLVMALLSTYASAGAADLNGVQRMMTLYDVAPVLTDIEETTGPSIVPGSEEFVLYSENTGRDYRISVGLPPGYGESTTVESYPVIYSLDGNWHFGIDAGTARSLLLGGEVDPVIVVSIGYPTDNDGEIMQLRAIDMLPGLEGPAFLAFVQQELKPYINETYLTDPEDSTLAGHSFGGLFTLNTLFSDTDAFDRYIAMSPALWYGPDYQGQRLIFDLEAAYASDNKKLPVDLFLSVGELEPEQMSNLWMVSNLIEFYEVMESRNYKKLDMDMVIIEGMGHAGCYPGSFARGVVEVNN